MSNRKERIAALLSKMDGDTLDQLEEALAGNVEEAPKKQSTSHEIQKRPNRRRGRGKKRREETTDLEEIEAQERPRRGNRGNKKRRRPRTQQRRVSKGKACRILEFDVDTPRENKFAEFIDDVALDGAEQQELQEAAKTDKKHKKRRRFNNNKRPNPMVWVRCVGCKDEFEVASSMVHNPKRYKCNDCSATACG